MGLFQMSAYDIRTASYHEMVVVPYAHHVLPPKRGDQRNLGLQYGEPTDRLTITAISSMIQSFPMMIEPFNAKIEAFG